MRSSKLGFTMLIAGLAALVPVTLGAQDSAYRGKASLEPASIIELRNEAGPTSVLFVAPEGKRVRKGALLVELDASALISRRAEARVLVDKARAEVDVVAASLEAAKAEFRAVIEVAERGTAVAEGALEAFLAEGGEYQLALTSAKSQIALAEARMDTAKVRVKRLEKLAEVGRLESPYELDEARLAIVEARAQLETARAQHRFLEEVFRGQKVSELKLAVAERKLDVVRATIELEGRVRKTQAHLAAAKSKAEVESEKLKRLEAHIESCKIHAPRDGTVMLPAGARPARRAGAVLAPGANVRPGQVLLRLADTSRYLLALAVRLAVAQRVAPGEEASIRIDAFPDRTFPGRVTKTGVVHDERRRAQGAVITVLLDDPEGELRPGLSASVDLALAGE